MKNHRQILLSFCASLIFIIAMPLHAQTNTYQKYPYGIGAQFSPSTWGLAYHQRFGESALQGVVGISYDPEPYYDSMLAYTVAFDYQRTLFGSDFSDYLGGQLYACVSLAHTGEIPYDYDLHTTSPFEAKIILGAGFGVEILFFQNFSLPIEFIYTFSYIPTATSLPESFGVELIPKIGLRYRFR